MFDVGFWELTFLMTLALLVLGPEKLPGLVTGVGRWLGRARAMARSLRLQIEREMAEPPAPPQAPAPPQKTAEDTGTQARNDPPGDSDAPDEPGTRF